MLHETPNKREQLLQARRAREVAINKQSQKSATGKLQKTSMDSAQKKNIMYVKKWANEKSDY